MKVCPLDNLFLNVFEISYYAGLQEHVSKSLDVLSNVETILISLAISCLISLKIQTVPRVL